MAPVSATACSSAPIKMSLARPPLSSTQALVARVVERERDSTCRRSSPGRVSITAPMPRDRSSRVVCALPEATTLRVSVSYKTASV